MDAVTLSEAVTLRKGDISAGLLLANARDNTALLEYGEQQAI